MANTPGTSRQRKDKTRRPSKRIQAAFKTARHPGYWSVSTGSKPSRRKYTEAELQQFAFPIPIGGFPLISSIDQGFESDTFSRLAAYYGITNKELANYLQIPSATLARRLEANQFNSVESDKIYRGLRILSHARDLFEGDQKAAAEWCLKPAVGLGDEIPLALSRSSAGTEAVVDHIMRIEHGSTN